MVGRPDRRLIDATGARAPIIAAPMAGAAGPALAIAAMRGGAIGSLPCGLLTADRVRAQVAEVRSGAKGPLNLNFFCHRLPEAPPDERAWRALLAPYYAEERVESGPPPPLRRPFDAAMCEIVEELRPEVVSFHFGLPEPGLVARVRAADALVLGNATTVDEARWLVAHGCDAVIAQGAEAGGHAGWFLDGHRPEPAAELLAGILAAVDVPVVAAGGIVDGAGIAAALRIGAGAVQIGTAYLATPESFISAPHRALLGTAASADAAFTTIFSGRAARGIRNRLMRELGDTNPLVPPFPHASAAIAPLRAHAERAGRGDYSQLWAGSGAPHVRAMDAELLTRTLAEAAQALLEGEHI